MKRIAVLPEGSVSHEAIEFLFNGEPLELYHSKLISDVFRATDNGKTQYSVIPIENTIEGSVSLHMDWLVNEVDIPMQAEWVYPSIQNVIGHGSEFATGDGGYDFGKITKIMSHPVAIPQCQNFIRTYSPEADLEGVNSTAEAVELVKKIRAKAGRPSAQSLRRRNTAWTSWRNGLRTMTTTILALCSSAMSRCKFRGNRTMSRQVCSSRFRRMLQGRCIRCYRHLHGGS